MRARMIELSWSGLRVPAIAVELDCSQKTVTVATDGCSPLFLPEVMTSFCAICGTGTPLVRKDRA